MSIDVHVLRKKVSRACNEAVRALLGSLLLYVSDRADRTQWAEDRQPRAGRLPQPQEAHQRPTRFQLLQAKFMGTGREPHLKRTREVGRLISKDKQGPGRSLVTATINKLLEKTKEGASSPGQRPPAGERPRGSPPGGKNTVKSILKKFLAAEEKEAKERGAGGKPPAPRPGAARGLLPRVMGRSSILSKLRQRFEQSGRLHSELGVLPLHREGRRGKGPQKKQPHRPEVRVLHLATMATSCTRTPPARFLACTAEPLPALSIATVVCSPQSWLSHCMRRSHSESRRWSRGENSVSPNLGFPVPSGNALPGAGPASREPRGQPKPSEASTPQAAAPGDSRVPLDVGWAPQLDSSQVCCEGEVLPGPMLGLCPLRPASLRGSGPVGGDGPGKPTAEGPVGHTWRPEGGVREVPEIAMTVCSSEDEEEPAPAALGGEPLFALQRHLPQQEALAGIPVLAPPGVQASRCTQPAVEPARITVQRPIVHEMPAPPAPLQSALCREDEHPRVSGGEAAVGNTPAAFTSVAEDPGAPGRRSRPCGEPESHHASSEPGSLKPLRDTASVDCHILPAALIPGLPKDPGGRGSRHGPENHSDLSGQSLSELGGEKCPLPEPNEAPAAHRGASSRLPTALKSHPGGTRSTAGSQQEPREGGLEGGSTVLEPPQDCRRAESPTARDGSVPCWLEECDFPLAELALRIAHGNTRHDAGKNRPSPLDGRPQTGIKDSKETGGNATSPIMPQPGDTQDPENKMAPQPGGVQDAKNKIGGVQDAKNKMGGVQDAENKIGGVQDAENKMGGVQDTENKIGGVQDTENKIGGVQDAKNKMGGVQDAENKIGGVQDAEKKMAPQPGGVQDAKKIGGVQDTENKMGGVQDTKKIGGVQDAENKIGGVQDTENKIGGVQDTENKIGGVQDTENKMGGVQDAKKIGGVQDAENKIGGVQDAENKIGGVQDAKNKTAPQPGGAQDPGNKTAEAWAALDKEQDRVLLAHRFVSNGNGLVEGGLLRELRDHHFLAPSGSLTHESGGTEGISVVDMAQCPPPLWVPSTTGPEEAASPCPEFTQHGLCKLSVNKGSAPTGIRTPTTEGDPLHKSTAPQTSPPRQPRPRQSPAGSPGHSLGQPQQSSANPQAQDRKGLKPASHLPPAGAPSSDCPTGPAPGQKARQAEHAQGQDPPGPCQPVERRAASQTRGSGPAQSGIRRPESRSGPEETVAGHMWTHQTSQPEASGEGWAAPLGQKAELSTAEPQARGAQDLVQGERAEMGEECLPVPWGRQAGSSAQGGSPQAHRSPAGPPGAPSGPCSLAVQGQASEMEPQAWDGPTEGVSAAGASGDPPRPVPRVCGPGTPGARQPPQGSQLPKGKKATTSPQEAAAASAQPTPDTQPQAQEGLPDTPGEKALVDQEHHRRSVNFAKYKAQSFSDQRAFELSFRSTVLRAGDTFEAPK